ncbi:hypothetical protein EV681_4536 [Advenella incenata]|uniref:Uncharacterized protein n=1 Tax=Advenella incenata TaxID=267800 RepID=A0A4Q7V797_9BURK|nr:hypothetical protein [Advenella incenata]RZT91183.1 hypothetical protein EV681_4536 [Advenella incenata]
MDYDQKLQEFKSSHLPKSSTALFAIQTQIIDLLKSGYTKQQIVEFVHFLEIKVGRTVIYQWLKENINTNTLESKATENDPHVPKTGAPQTSPYTLEVEPLITGDIKNEAKADFQSVNLPGSANSPLPKSISSDSSKNNPSSSELPASSDNRTHKERLAAFLGKSQEEQLKEMRDN